MDPVRLGNHELLVRLASGGAANVFLVRDLASPRQERLLALKILLPSLASNEDFLNMFFAEARIASRLNHDNVVAITGFGQVEGIHCLAMEYVFGASLAQVLRASARAKKPLTVGVLLRITAAVCDALHFAHETVDDTGEAMGLVHRDVTPQNILISFNGVPKLTDFGIAKATGRGWETQAGIVKGKFSYMSPEQALGKKVDRRSDIFGAGIVLWEALTGRDLFRGSTPMEVLTAIREQKIDPPSKVVAGLTPIVDPIVMKALRRSPRQRYQTAAEMRDDILDLIHRAGVEIDAATIAKELGSIYGEEIGSRAVELRKAMAGKADVEKLAKVLGGHRLNPKHLPVIPGGVTDPDPLGLFASEESSFAPRPETPAPIEPMGTRTDFEIVDVVSEVIQSPWDGADGKTAWNEADAPELGDDELLSMLSEEDATVGFVPKAFEEKFGARPRRTLDDDDISPTFEDDEMTVGIASSEIEAVAENWDDPPPYYDEAPRSPVPGPDARGASVTESGGNRPGASSQERAVPQAPSLELPLSRPFPRAPSLDIDEGARTPSPALAPSKPAEGANGVEIAPPDPTEPYLPRVQARERTASETAGPMDPVPSPVEPPAPAAKQGGVRMSWPVFSLFSVALLAGGYFVGLYQTTLIDLF